VLDDEETGAARRILRDKQARGTPAPGHQATAAEAVDLIGDLLADLADLAGSEPSADNPAEILAALVLLRRMREELAGWEPRLIDAARAHGVSWSRLAPALGVTTRQAAERRYLRTKPSPSGETTGEARVRAARDRRAGDRAVDVWARQNAGSLRQLAGEISAVEPTDLTSGGRRQVRAVLAALGDTDPATLLAPLRAVGRHLTAGHAPLGERIEDITKQTEQIHERSRSGQSDARPGSG
jgi:hypothetical protein